MYDFMGPWILVSRGEAMSLIVLTVLMVLLLTRGLMTFVRNYTGWSAVLQNIVDKHALMHQWCGRMLPVCAALHILGHLRGSIPAIINEKDNAKINEVFTYGTKIKFNFNSWGGALLSYPAVTGLLLVLILILFWSFSNEYVRRRSFELFHYPHLILIVAWTLGLWAHGARQWLGCGVPLGLLAVAPTVLFYFATRVMDIYQCKRDSVKIKSATLKKKTVLLEIDVKNSGYVYETGMYCMIKVPAISEFEWHPFTIASRGGSPVVQLLFAVVGDWTTRFKELLEEAQRNSGPYPSICLRGGYGAPAEGMRDSKHVVLVGAGVGATPFLSFLASFCSEAQEGVGGKFDGVESAAFYWVSREPEDFVWVNRYHSLIKATPALRNRLSMHLCLTKSLETTAGKDCSAAEAAMFWLGVQVAMGKFRAAELEAELGVPTQFGRPNWHQELRRHSDSLLGKGGGSVMGPTCTGRKGELEINVFVCGNAMLVNSLEQACDDLDDDEVIFRLFAEQF
jgi:predicted ferric reductase